MRRKPRFNWPNVVELALRIFRLWDFIERYLRDLP
jgi:hypothetical protein